MMRGMMSAGREIQEEWFIRCHLLAICDELDRLVGQILSEVITLFRSFRRIDLVVVVYEVGIVLLGVAAEKSVLSFEATAERPAIIWTGGACLIGWRQMPLAKAERGIAVVQQNFRQKTILKGNHTI